VLGNIWRRVKSCRLCSFLQLTPNFSKFFLISLFFLQPALLMWITGALKANVTACRYHLPLIRLPDQCGNLDTVCTHTLMMLQDDEQKLMTLRKCGLRRHQLAVFNKMSDAVSIAFSVYMHG